MRSFKESWADKYYPRTLEDLVLPTDDYTLLTELMETGYCPYKGVLLHSIEGGTGKTSYVNVLKNEDYDVLEVLSTHTGVKDVLALETKLQQSWWNFVSRKKTLVVINEISESSSAFRQGLRHLIDNYSKVAFFIFTDNNFLLAPRTISLISPLTGESNFIFSFCFGGKLTFRAIPFGIPFPNVSCVILIM